LLVVATLYLAMLPFAFASYQRVTRRRAASAAHASAGSPQPVRKPVASK
jgi:hypothetical protein